MASDQSAKLALPYLAAAQAQKHVTHNEALRRLDAYVQLVLESISAPAPPAAPAEGACWFVPEGAAGAFAGRAGMIATHEAGAFDFLPLPAGAIAFIRDEWRLALYDGGAWVSPLAGTVNRAAIEASVLEEDVVLSGDFTETGIVIPARAIVLGVSTRTLATVSGASSYDCGVAGEVSKFGGMLGVAQGATNSGVVGPTAFYAPTPVRLTANDGAFAGGRVRVAIHFLACPVAEAFVGAQPWWHESAFLLDETAPSLAADFVRERYAANAAERSSPDIVIRTGGNKTVTAANGSLAVIGGTSLTFDYSSGRRRLILEGSATNLFIGSASPADAKTVTTSAQAYTLSFWGTGTIALSGAFDGSVTGSGADVRTSYSFTATAGSLVLTPSGAVTGVQLEVGSQATSYIETTTAAATRVTDICKLSEAAVAAVSGDGATIALRCQVNYIGNVVSYLIGNASSWIVFENHVKVHAGNGAGSSDVIVGNVGGDGIISLCLSWDADGRRGVTNGGSVFEDANLIASPTDLYVSSAWGLPNRKVIELDELLIWPVKGSASAIVSQAREWA